MAGVATAVPVIKLSEVKFAIDACATATKRAAEATAADQIKKAAMCGLFERVLGVKSLDDVAHLSPDEIAKMIRRRMKKGELELEGIDVDVLIAVIQKSQERRNISWKEAFIAKCGAAAAAEVENSTPVSYSYRAGKVLGL